MKKFLLLLLLLSAPSWAATYYVKNTATCANHGTVLGASCSYTSASCGSASVPCCDLESALRKTALTNGDTVEVHDGTYNTAGSAGATCKAFTGYAGPSHTRYYQALLDDVGVTITVPTGDTATMDLENTCNIGIWLANADNATVEKIRVIDKADAGVWDGDYGYSRTGCFIVAGTTNETAHTTGATIQDTYCEVPNNSTTTISSLTCVTVFAADNLIYRRNTCVGDFNTGVLLMDSDGSGLTSGYWFDGNTFTCTRPYLENNTSTAWISENINATGAIVSSNNLFDFTASASPHRWLYLRESSAPHYIFNNRFLATSGQSHAYDIYFQEDGGTREENYWIFNNTFQSGGGAIGTWPNCIDAQIRNNVFYQYGSPMLEQSACSGGDGSSLRSGSLTYNATSSSSLASCSTDCVATTGSVTSATINLTAAGRLQSSSTSCIGTGTSNPLDQGANVCSVTAAGQAISCLADFEGNTRGASWDIGADQLTGGTVSGNSHGPYGGTLVGGAIP